VGKDREQTSEQFIQASAAIKRCRTEIGRRLVGQQRMVDGMLIALIAGGHVLIEGVPGLAKTLAVKTLAEVLAVDYKRIQFTPDLLPADLVGTLVYRQETGQFVPRKGPIFTNVVLGDEINRAPAKVQSALLEAMAERQVTIGDETYQLTFPFFVLATQNPIEHEGTYPLPEAQLDRFMLKLSVAYPSKEEEVEIIRRVGVERAIPVRQVITVEDLTQIQEAASGISVDEKIEHYIVDLVQATRSRDRNRYAFVRFIEFGASPRASIYLLRCAKVVALFAGRNYLIPDDVKAVAHQVLRHRLVLSYEAESEELGPDQIINSVLSSVSVP
jgi:MoxR-like ATPase